MAKIIFSKNRQMNQKAALAILSDLPEWFGIPESTQAYVAAAGDELCLLAETAGDCVGFISLIETETAFEIDCMGVLKVYQGQGIGSAMIEELKNAARQYGKTSLLVKTLSEAHPSQDYVQTRAFYSKMGFCVHRHLDIWGDKLPCLEMILIL